MTMLLWVCVALGFAAAFVRRGWIAIPLSLVVGFLPSILDLTWDNGATIPFLSRWTLIWPVLTAIGYGLNVRIRARRARMARADEEESTQRRESGTRRR